jgi:hypothetical protein
MGVQLLSGLDPAAETERLTQWAAGYRESGGPGGLLAPAREAAEHWAAAIRGVGRDEISQRDLADPGPLLGHGAARDPAHQAWMSQQRVAFAGGRRVLAEWRLDDLFDVRALEWTQALYPRLSGIVRDAQDSMDGDSPHRL